MSSLAIDRRVFADVSWWHWALTIPLLAAGLAGYAWAIAAAMGLCVMAGAYFLFVLKKLRPMPVQVRIAYLALLAIGTLPWMQWIHWAQLAGTTTMVTLGYCPLIRILSVAPPNRTEPLTASLIWQVFVRSPCVGGLVPWSAAPPSPAVGCCSLSTRRSAMACSIPRPTSVPKEHRYGPAY